MPSHYPQAGQAIGEVVAHRFPRNAINWGNIVPSAAPWNMNLALWTEMLREMRERFEPLIAPCRIRSGETFAGSLNKPLYVLQRRLNDSVVCPGEEGFDD